MTLPPTIASHSRRSLLRSVGLSAPAVALLVGVSSPAHAQGSKGVDSQDVDVLNEILGTEHEGISAYQTLMEGGLLLRPQHGLARLIQSHHKTHRDFLAGTINRLGGAPVAAKSDKEYATDLNIHQVKNQYGALTLAIMLEQGAANAYLDMLPSIKDGELSKAAARVAADEVMHWTALRGVQRQELPSEAMSFGI